jgi:16S rRNA (cytosine967-C5)-methyltransferase
MTPSARLSAAMAVLDRVLSGASAENVLTNWARSSRFAGSGDRAAVRDLVFDAIRCQRSFAALGGSLSGRGLVLGGLREQGTDPTPFFTGVGYAPYPLTEAEQTLPIAIPDHVALDCPDWLAPSLRDSLGEDFRAVMQILRARAPVFLRVNVVRTTRDTVQTALSAEGIHTVPHPLANNALEVIEGKRKIKISEAYLSGLVELQDVASQAIVAALPLQPKHRVLDYCAGGGGKTLAMAACAELELYAHDADPHRMGDLLVRAGRAGIRVELLDAGDVVRVAPFDLVLADVPCSGSGTWRRAPEAKWALTQARLDALCTTQASILDRVSDLVVKGGHIAYVTCSLLDVENGVQIGAFLERTPGWHQVYHKRFTPRHGGDGFFLSVLTHE